MVMTKLLNKAFETLSKWPQDRQDEIAKMLLDWVEQQQSGLALTEEQEAEVRRRLSLPADYASDEEVEAIFSRRTS